MKDRFKNYWWVALLVFYGGLATHSPAQEFAILHSFSAIGSYTTNIDNIVYTISTNSEGAGPSGKLILSGNVLYGAAGGGGASGIGTLYRVNTDGSGFSPLHTFEASSIYPAGFTNEDGGSPVELILSEGMLYGVCAYGGRWGNGTVFKVNINGTGFTTLHHFTNSEGRFPRAALTISGSTLYGTALYGGAGFGTVFTLQTDGSGFRNLHTFQSASDGAYPLAHLNLVGDSLYGTTEEGWQNLSGKGTAFTLRTNGNDFRVLHYFMTDEGNMPQDCLLAGNMLYGTTLGAFNTSGGSIFALSIDGSLFKVLHKFPFGSDPLNPEGAFPSGNLVLLANTLYGTAARGGDYGNGLLFGVNTDGSSFRIIHVFTGQSDGAIPASLTLAGTTIYGVTSGGDFDTGTLFSVSLPPQLLIAAAGSNMILSWPTNFQGYALESSTSFDSSVWVTNLPPPLIADGQYIATNAISGTRQFFRLRQLGISSMREGASSQ